MVQPGGSWLGQVKLAATSSTVIPEKDEPQARPSILILRKAYPSGENYIIDS